MRNSVYFLAAAIALFTLCSLNAQTELTGEVEGAKYVVHLPAAPTGNLLLLAHGYRPEGLPLDADIGASHDLFKDLVEEGWAVASTSYRRNGWIMEDAAKDMINLRQVIADEGSFEPDHVFLFGNSMGGGVVTWLAEHAPEGFDGGLALGAYLFEPIDPEGEASTQLADYYSGTPQFPILYLTNVSELEGPSAYLELAKDAPVPPVLWFVDREGHVNQNELEQYGGILGLVKWVETGKIRPFNDGTIEMNPPSTAVLTAESATGKAVSLVPVYGNFISSFVSADLETLGLQEGDLFTLTAGGESVRVLLGSTYNDVEVGEWVAFWDAQGYLLFCRNYKNAVETLGLSKDDSIAIHRTEGM
ncbi:MAG: SAM hydroxide adenosyltransferase [Verrucomicrobiota bacterium]